MLHVLLVFKIYLDVDTDFFTRQGTLLKQLTFMKYVMTLNLKKLTLYVLCCVILKCKFCAIQMKRDTF